MHNSVVPGHVRPRVNLQIVVEQHNRKLLKVKTAHNVANRFFQLDSHSQAQEKLLRLYTSSLRKTTETSTGCSRADAPAAGPLPGCHYSRHGAGRVSTNDSHLSATWPHVPETAELQAGRLRIQQANGQRKRFDVTGFCVRARSCASEKASKHSRSRADSGDPRERLSCAAFRLARRHAYAPNDTTVAAANSFKSNLGVRRCCTSAIARVCAPAWGSAARVPGQAPLRHVGTRHAVGPRSRVKVLSSDARVASRRRGWCQGPSTVKGPTLSRPQCAARLP